MSNAMSVAQAYIETWNATEAPQRSALLREHWRIDASYVDPLMAGEGAAQIDGLIRAVHERFPGFRFTLRGVPDGHGDHVRLAWSLGPDGVDAPIEGSDVVELREGKIGKVIGFIDKVPASA